MAHLIILSALFFYANSSGKYNLTIKPLLCKMFLPLSLSILLFFTGVCPRGNEIPCAGTCNEAQTTKMTYGVAVKTCNTRKKKVTVRLNTFPTKILESSKWIALSWKTSVWYQSKTAELVTRRCMLARESRKVRAAAVD